MNLRTLIAVCGFCLALVPSLAAAQAPAPLPLRYKWTVGQTLCYLVQRDPYFANPAGAIETTNPNAPYRPPVVQRLTEHILAVGRDGAGTVRLTLTPEPGFEDGTPPVTQTVTVTPMGQVISENLASLMPELLSAIFRLPETPTPIRGTVAVLIQEGLPSVTKSTSPSHDGLLLQTTHSRRSDRVVFDIGAGNLLRRTGTITGSLSLVMTQRGGRGSDDFGRVVPNLPIFQTLTIERHDDLLPAAALPSRASTVRRSKS